MFSQNCSDNEEDIEEEMESFGEGAVFNDFDRNDNTLIKMDQIITMNITESSLEENDQNPEMEYLDPRDAITKEDENSLLKTAIQLEPDRHEISNPLQITAGSTSSPTYVKSVMLMVRSNMRVLSLTRAQEIQLQMLADNNHKEANAALDAWLLINGKTRPEFDVKVLVTTFPGIKSYLKEYKSTTEESDDETSDFGDLHGDGGDDEDSGDVSDYDSDDNQEDNVESRASCDDKEQLDETEDETEDEDDDDNESNHGNHTNSQETDGHDTDKNDESAKKPIQGTKTNTWLVKFKSWLKK